MRLAKIMKSLKLRDRTLSGELDARTMLKMYGLGRQSRFGNNKTPKPSMILDPVKYYPWEAWNKLKGMKVKVAREKTIVLME